MATVIGGISRLFQPTLGVLSAEKICQGSNPWYFLIGLRMVTLFFAYGPWDSLKADLICRWPSDLGDGKTFCSALCYNQRFLVPISGFWIFHFIVIMFTVSLLKFAYVTKKSPFGKDEEAVLKPKPTTASPRVVDDGPHFGGWRYGIYIFCILLLLAIDVAFIWTLLGLQLPIMRQEVTICHPNHPACPASGQCVVNSLSDKRAILWVLAFCSAANIVFCISYLSAHCCQACGFCRDPEKARPREYVCHCHDVGCDTCQGDYNSRTEKAEAGAARCGCQPEGGSCFCRHGNNGSRDMACGCQDNRLCPCYFLGSEARPSSLTGREDLERKLLRGDTEIGEEKKRNREAAEKWMQMNEHIRTEAQRGQGSPRGGMAVKSMAKYQP